MEREILDTRPAKNFSPPSPFLQKDATLSNFCSASLGARVLFATDEWFASADNLLKDDDPMFDPLAFCEQGKVMDGWESRRRREVGHDWCLIKLAKRTTSLVGVEIDTAHFTGNNVPRISLELADLSCEDETKMASQVILNQPDDSLERQLATGDIPVHRIGDCREKSFIDGAILDARKLVQELEAATG